MKKALSMVLLLSMLAGMLSIGAAASLVVDDTFTLGDVNGDGVSDLTDALEVARYLADVEGAEVIRDAADMDADGQVSAYDALQFKLCIAGAKQWSDYEVGEGEYGEALYNLTIAGNPITTYCIVVPEGTDPETSNLYYGPICCASIPEWQRAITWKSAMAHRVRRTQSISIRRMRTGSLE